MELVYPEISCFFIKNIFTIAKTKGSTHLQKKLFEDL